MEPRMKNPAVVIPEAMEPIKAILGATYRGGVAPATLALVHLRASQINGCCSCIDSGIGSTSRRGKW
jgi:alkylhydroperoxidase family enzyme